MRSNLRRKALERVDWGRISFRRKQKSGNSARALVTSTQALVLS